MAPVGDDTFLLVTIKTELVMSSPGNAENGLVVSYLTIVYDLVFLGLER